MVPVLLEAIKQQQKQLGTLQKIVISQEKDIQNLKNNAESGNLKSKVFEDTNNDFSQAILFDNVPNPFNQKSVIKYFIPETAFSACLLITDLQGKEIVSYDIQDRNSGSITISSSKLYPGIFVYTLVVDNKIIDSERMVLTNN